MTMFGKLVEDINKTKAINGNGAVLQPHDEDTWIRKELLPTIGRYVAAQVRPLKDQIAKMKLQIEELQAGGVKFCGTYQRAIPYKRGDQVVYDGSGWVAVTDIKPLEIPGKFAGWHVFARGGRDGKDLRRDP
jgi:hypothetical protein